MAYKDCTDIIKAAAGRPLTDKDIEDLAFAADKHIRAKLAEGLDLPTAVRRVGEEDADQIKMLKSLARREAYGNLMKQVALDVRTVAGEENLSLQRATQGAVAGTGREYGLGVSQKHYGILEGWTGAAIADLRKAGVLRLFGAEGLIHRRDLVFERDVARELRRRDDPTMEKATGSAQAVEAARIIGRMFDTQRASLNAAGAWVAKAPGYMGRQFHDMYKVFGKGTEADKQAWMQSIKQHFDMDKSFPELNPTEIDAHLAASWNSISTGVFDASGGDFRPPGPGNLGRKVSQQRTFQPKSADDWFDYNQQYGKGGVLDAAWAGADKAARDTALLQTFGTRPRQAFDAWHNRMREAAAARGDQAAVQALGQPGHGLQSKLFDIVSGMNNAPARQNLAYIGSTARNVMQMLHLGRVLFSVLPDVVIGANTLRVNGVNFWAALGHQIAAIVPPSAAQRDIADSLGAGIQGMIGHMINRFRVEDGVPGAMAEAVNTFHRFNGLTYWTDAQKVGMGLALSHNLAKMIGRSFDTLDAKLQGSLRRYGIEAAEWDAARAAPTRAADGRDYMMPQEIGDQAVAQKLQSYITDQIKEALNDPTPLSRVALTFGTDPGTYHGELMRMMTQFRSFTFTFMERHMGRTLHREGFDAPGAAYLMAGLTMAGYAGLVLGDLSSNRTPQDITNPDQMLQIVANSMVNGGALGLYGDVLFRKDTSGSDVLSSLFGPAPKTFGDIVGALHAVGQGSQTKSRGEVALAKIGQIAEKNLPNLFYTKGVYDYLVPYLLSELTNPGTIQRREQMLQRNGQDFILHP